MRQSKIGLTLGETINTGNYSSKRIEIYLEADLDLTDDSNSIYELLKNQINQKITEYKKELVFEQNIGKL